MDGFFFSVDADIDFHVDADVDSVFTPTGPWENPANSNWVLGKNHDQACF